MGAIRIAELPRAALRAVLALLLAVAVVVAVPAPARADAPGVTPIADQVFTEGDSFTASTLATWADGSGATPTYSATVDFGLGGGDEACDGDPCTLIVDGGGDTGSVTGSFTYPDDTGGPFTVTVKVTDGVAAEGSGSFQVTVSNADPVLTVRNNLSVPEGTTVNLSGGTGTSFTDAGVLDTHTATVDWGEGAGPVPATVGAGVVNASNLYEDDTGGPFIVEVVITDDDGGSDTEQFLVTINNANPVLTVRGSLMVPEGTTVNLSGGTGTSFTDVGTADTHTATVDWGEGAGPVAATVGAGVVNASNLYEDDTGGPFTVTVVLTDDDGGSDTEQFTVTITNANPVLTVRDSLTVPEGTTVNLSGGTGTTFTDVGTADTHTATVDWGAGPIGATVGAGVVNASNLYEDENGSPFTVTVVLTDDDTGSDTGSFTVTVNNANPVVAARADASVENGATVTLSAGGGTSYTDPGTTDTHTNAMVDWGDGSPIEPATNVPGGGGTGTITGSHAFSTGGPYTVTVSIDDNDGGSGSDTFTVTVTNSPFTVSAGGDQVVDEGATVNVSAGYNDTDGAGTHTATINWGDGTTDNCPAVCSITDVSGVGTVSGSHVYPEDNPTAYTVTVTVQDETSDVAADALDVTVNDVAPTLTLSGNASVNEGSVYTLTIGPITDPGDDIVTDWIVDWGDGTAPQTFTAGGDRTHTYADGTTNPTISIDLIDEDDTYANVDTLSITVNNVAPTIALSGSGPVDEGGTFTLTLGAVTDPGVETPTGYTIDWGDGTAPEPVAATPGDVTHIYADGPTTPTISVSVTDEDGTFAGAGTLGVTVNNVAPTVTAPATATIVEGDTLSSVISFSDPGDDTHEARIDYGAGFGTWGAATTGFSLSNLYQQDGTFTVTIEVRDEDLDVGSDSIALTVTNADPVVTPRGDVDVPEGTTVFIGGGGGTSFTDLGVLDIHAATIDWDEGAGPEAADVTEANGSGTLGFPSGHTYDTPGVYTVAVVVTDQDGGIGTASFTVNVQNLDLLVDANPDGPMTVDEGDTVSVTADFTDNDGTGTYSATIDWGDGTVADCSTSACTLTGGGGGTGTVTGSHTYPQDGTFTVTVTVDDGGLDIGFNGFTYTVQNVLPTTNVTGPATSDEGTQIQLLGNPTDPGADALTYSWTVTKNGDFFKAGSNPNILVRPDDNGAYAAAFTAFDDDGQSLVDTFNWTVVNLDPTAVIIDVDTGDPVVGVAEIGVEGTTITLGADVSDEGADTFTYDWAITQPGSDPIIGSNPTISFVSPDDGLFFVSLTVTDDDGGSSAPPAPIISVVNGDPVIQNIVTDPTPSVGATVSLGVFFDDPGALDTLTVTIDWGDGDTDTIPNATTPVTASHSYPSAGARQAEVCVEDDDGGTTCATWWYNVGGSLSTAPDYNGDGYEDLAVGIPGEDDGAGAVQVIYGSVDGLQGSNDQFLRQGIGGVLGSNEAGDAFGAVLAHGDFNGDGFADLAIAAPGEDLGGVSDAGNVTVILGSASGLNLTTDVVWHQNKGGIPDVNEAGDGFGQALVAGDFNGDAYADLAIGTPFEDVGPDADTGRVTVLFGSPSGLTTSNARLLDQEVGSITNSNQPDDHYGAALAAGDFDGDGFTDLAVGVPGQKVSGNNRAGAINVLFGRALGPDVDGSDLFIRQGFNGINGTAKLNDEFGSVLAAGDVNGDGFDDLAAGVPGDAVSGKVDAGTLSLMPGSGSGPSGTNDVLFREGGMLDGKTNKNDRFGSSVAVGDINGDGFEDLLVGIPNQKYNRRIQAGVVAYIPGSATLNAVGNSRWHEDKNNILGTSEKADHLGAAVAIVDVNGNGRADLILGIPDQDGDTGRKNVGAALVIRGGKNGPVKVNDAFIWQGVDGLNDNQQKFDRFGAAF